MNKMNNFKKIKQILPIPETLTPMVRASHEDGSESWVDAAGAGSLVLLALVDDGQEGHVSCYASDAMGYGGLDDYGEEARLVPAFRCRNCGERMQANADRNYVKIRYSCPCGYTFEYPLD